MIDPSEIPDWDAHYQPGQPMRLPRSNEAVIDELERQVAAHDRIAAEVMGAPFSEVLLPVGMFAARLSAHFENAIRAIRSLP